MAGSSFCDQCGAPLAAGARFCEGCGAPVASATHAATPEAPTPQPSPAASPPPTTPTPAPPPSAGSSLKPAHVVVAIVLVVVAAGVWKATRPASPPPAPIAGALGSAPIGSDLGAGGASTPSTSSGAPAIGSDAIQAPDVARPVPIGSEAPASALSAYVGPWVEDNGPGRSRNTFELTEVAGHIRGVITPDGDSVDLAPDGPDRLKGTYTSKGEHIPLTAEFADGDRLKLVLAPPASEFVTVYARRPEGIGSASAGGGPVSAAEAEALVRALPAVKQWLGVLGAAGASRAHIDVEPDGPSKYSVHVYEVVDDGGGASHSATQGWYEVDRRTRRVTSQMP